jgi:hypothetical protein
MINWLYKGNKIENIEDFGKQTPFGFVYLISNTIDGRIYIGKKFLQHKKTKKLGKKVMAEQTGPGRKKTKEVSYAESDWKTYWGSCKPLLEDVKHLGEDKFYREILDLAWSSKHLSYLEAKYQFKTDVLETNSYNDNIQARYYRKDLAIPSPIDIL